MLLNDDKTVPLKISELPEPIVKPPPWKKTSTGKSGTWGRRVLVPAGKSLE